MTTTPTDDRPATAGPPESIPADTFAARLRLARMHAADITIRDAADMCGLNYGSWSNWERGAAPRNLIEIVETISAKLSVDRDWLLFGGPLAGADENRRRWPGGIRNSSWLLRPAAASTRSVARPPNRTGFTRPGDGQLQAAA